jgi:carboxypeptidase Taq
MTQQEAFARLEAIDREVVLLSHINGVLVWDQESVPPAGIEERSRQMGLLERKIHELSSSEQIGELLEALGAHCGREDGDPALDERSRALVRWYHRVYNRSRKLDADFVQEFSETTAQAHQTWAAARKNNDFSLYEPVLSRIVEMVRRKSEAYGYTDDPYDPLLDAFESGTTTAEVEQLFWMMRRDLQEILLAKGEEEPVDDTFLYGTYAQDKQALFAKEVLDAMGFDWNRGISGVSTHPYTISLGSDDIRITTRFTEPSVISPLFSSIHEAGHALYEMGASNEVTRGTSLANGASFAFHESQSRLWENMIGRSRAFWSCFFPRMKELFPIQLEYVDLGMFMKAINRVRPSNIRVDADEVTYGLHIILRFELEREMLSGNLAVRDLPGAWNERMEQLLGIRPQDDRVGVLQDVHWSMGEFGYFPTYALGNLYGAQILDSMKRDLDVDAAVSTGDFTPVRQWLDRNILRFGAMYRPKDLLLKVTGAPLDARYFRDYLSHTYLGGNHS